ncbi:hypothetical protein LPJ64_000054 [Coemansia asiatica]|uniref:HCP-like protein n=1 Tax=Coemansia asiatica TaxID=1052880 RepID=A0A9W8CNG2_9FUNG|nr:hypothetical protein LPJ64_000054 [Coemansia asiatica]
MKILHYLVLFISIAIFTGANPIYKEIAHSLGYDYVQASNAGAAVSDSIRGLVNAVGSLDQFKPIIHPDVVGTINAVENYGGLISSLVGFVIKLVVRYLYSSDLLNDTPYIGELIRNADHMIEPQYTNTNRTVLKPMDHNQSPRDSTGSNNGGQQQQQQQGQQVRASGDYLQSQLPTAQFSQMSIQGAPSAGTIDHYGAALAGGGSGTSAYPQPTVHFMPAQGAGAMFSSTTNSPGNAEFGADVSSGFDDQGYSHYQHLNPNGMPSGQADPGNIDGFQASSLGMGPASSGSSVDERSSESNDLASAPRAPGMGGISLHQFSSQPKLNDNSSMEFAPRPRPRVKPGRSSLNPGAGGGGEPNPFLTYSRNSIYSSSQTSLNNRSSMYGLNNSTAKRMSHTLVSGSNALDMYREAAKKTQDERIQLEYAKFLIQSIENLEDPVVREEINVTYSIYMPGNDVMGGFPGSAAASSASLPLGQQATGVDPENREKLISEAVYWIKHLQRKGNTEASYIAGTWFEKGMYGIEQDKSKAVQLFTYAAKNHHASAAYKVGVYNEERKSSGRAFSYYQMAAALGDVSANYRMAKVFLDGDFHKKANVKQALVYLRRSAELATKECPDGALLLGEMYMGIYEDNAVYECIFYDAEEGQKLLDKAAHLGSIEAQYQLGHFFEFGVHGFPVDPKTSVHYYQMAAEQDNARAQMALSGWYLSGGDGVPIDDRLAFDWGHRAAQQGLTRAMYAMGYYYEMGIGCSKDMDRAKEWYERAAADGSKEAKERLDQGIAGASSLSTAALRRHVTQKRQKGVVGAKGKRRKGGLLGGRDKSKDDGDGDKCIVM